MKKIYIIDDDRNIVDALRMVLESSGYAVGAQNDERDAVERVRAFGADLIILDVMFPEDEGAGFQVARALRSHEETRSIPILMLSAVNEKRIYPGRFTDDDRDETWMPVDLFLEKPIQPRVLLTKVTQLLGDKADGVPG